MQLSDGCGISTGDLRFGTFDDRFMIGVYLYLGCFTWDE